MLDIAAIQPQGPKSSADADSLLRPSLRFLSCQLSAKELQGITGVDQGLKATVKVGLTFGPPACTTGDHTLS